MSSWDIAFMWLSFVLASGFCIDYMINKNPYSLIKAFGWLMVGFGDLGLKGGI